MAKTNNEKRPSGFSLMLRKMFLGGAAGKSKLNERYDSPSKQAVKRFFRKPLAVTALVVLVAMFLLVFICPAVYPIDLSYSEALHKNVSPTMSLMSLPSEMEKNPQNISSLGSFTLGLDQEGNVHTWGYYYTPSNEAIKDVMQIPQAVQDANIKFAAAGTDHCVAIDDTGKIHCWGEDDNSQYGKDGLLTEFNEHRQPDELIEGTIDINNVKELVCGNQITAIVNKDGTAWIWGNHLTFLNLSSIGKEMRKNGVKFEKIVFTNDAVFGLSTEGKFIPGNNKQFVLYKGQDTFEYIGNRKVIDIASTGDSLALVLDDGEIMCMGKITELPVIPEGEEISSIDAGSRHYVITTKSGKVIAWGSGALGQTAVPEELSADLVFAAGFQNYAFKNGESVDNWGLSGYLMGTDDMGRDVFNRVVNGDKMTMTIGAVAVIVSSIIGIIVGCLSGYFGGWVDMLLMRVTEIFSAIPFLPFALVLSSVLRQSTLSEDTRIFIIMIILGVLSWTGLAKLVRAQILAEREKEFVVAAQSMGVKESRIAFKHILPNVISVVIVSLTLDFATCMLTESSLSYLGFGVKLPRPTWGNMLDGCRDSNVIQNYWWRWVFPALFLAITVICINIIGDTLRDIFDPKSEVEK